MTDTKSKSTKKSPDGLDDEALVAYRGEDYAYLDQTRDEAPPAGNDDVSVATLNPAFYPASVKPEAQHGEDEKAGADYPGGPLPKDVKDESVKAEDLPAVKAEQQAEKAKS